MPGTMFHVVRQFQGNSDIFICFDAAGFFRFKMELSMELSFSPHHTNELDALNYNIFVASKESERETEREKNCSFPESFGMWTELVCWCI